MSIFFSQLLEAIHHFGTQTVPEEERYRVRVANVVALLGALISAGYGLFYLFGLHAIAAFAVNNLFVASYLGYFGFLRKRHPVSAKSWLALVFGVHLLVLMLVFFDRETGLQLFLVAGCPIAFLLFGQGEQRQRNASCVFYVASFLATEWLPSLGLLGQLSPAVNRAIYLTTVMMVVLLMVQVMVVFLVEMDRRAVALQQLSVTDPLTGLNNRRGFTDKVKALQALSARTGRILTIIMLDIDHFKRVNDQHGHPVGDTVLVGVAHTLLASVRREDVVGRVGGEEFAVALLGSSLADSLNTAETLRQRVALLRTPVAGGAVVACTISLGVATVRAEEPDIDLALTRADTALYQAKQQGRNQVCASA